MDRSGKYLDSIDFEKLVCHIFDFDKIMRSEGQTTPSLDYGEAEFTDVVHQLTAGPLALPATPCSDSCQGARCHCLTAQ